MLTGNKGEWSEIYVFLKLLADGKLKAADENLNVMPDICYPIIKILRQENKNPREYHVNGAIKIVDGKTGKEIASIPVHTFLDYSQRLFNALKQAEGRSFAFQDIEEFLNTIDVNSLTNPTDKTDITIVIHDPRKQPNPQLGFSIKSMLGGAATLLNAGETTNFIYEIIGGENIDIKKYNEILAPPKITRRIISLYKDGFSLILDKLACSTFERNLELIDSRFPQILSELLLIRYSADNASSKLIENVEKLKIKNPLGIDLSQGHPFYEYKIKKFLADVALGMTPAKTWSGRHNATGGIIIVKKDGETVCYNLYNYNEFEDYLINNTRFEQGGTTRHKFGDLYNEDGKTFIKLNLQIRFNN